MSSYNRPGQYGNRSYRRRRPGGGKTLFIILVVLLLAVIITIGALLLLNNTNVAAPDKTKPQGSKTPGKTPNGQTASPSAEPSVSSLLPEDLKISPTENTDPSKLGFITKIYNDTTEAQSYTRPQPIFFGGAEDYTSLEGIVTFRGNNFRNLSGYGTADVKEGALTKVWAKNTGSLKKDTGSGAWTGTGWTGQPLIVKWPEDIKKIMNISDKFKNDPNFVEVIYPCEDGNIYFKDLYSGEDSRQPMKLGVTFKGTASLYPNGTPMLFIGQGDTAKNAGTADWKSKYYIISLVDQSILYKIVGTDDPNKYREQYAFFDSSSLVNAETDTLIEPGENGVLYTMKLNTQFDKAKGTLSIKPEKPVKFTYTSPKYSNDKAKGKHWWGMESSCVIWRNYLTVADNGGTLMCIDLNTMKLIWASDNIDDTNSSPVLEESEADKTAYIYTGNTIEDQNLPEKVTIRKVDIKTGEAVKTKEYDCFCDKTVESGVYGTPILGKGDISNLVIYPLSQYPGRGKGCLVALDKNTLEEVWRFETDHYLWSSPVTFYTKEGKAYIVEFDAGGTIYVIDGKGHQVNKYAAPDYDSAYNEEQPHVTIEASAGVYNDMLVIGTRGQKMYGFKIK